jgi:hypothetical protein
MKHRKSRSIPYPIIAFILLFVGVLLLAWTLRVNAETGSYSVSAQVDAAIPTVPPDITKPVDGSETDTSPITVSGTCQTNTYENIMDNSVMSGSALCTSSGTFTLQISLFSGSNELIADSFNLTNNAGPASAPVTITYNPPIVTQPTGSQSSSGTTSTGSSSGSSGSGTSKPKSSTSTTTPALSLTTNFSYQGYYIGQSVQWQISINGGLSPYALSIDWGDGTSNLISRQASGLFTISHEYNQVSKSGHIIQIKVTDILGNTSYLQFFAVVNAPKQAVIIGSPAIPENFSSNKNWLFIAWPFYVVITLMTVSFWLGKREEFQDLNKHHLLRSS